MSKPKPSSGELSLSTPKIRVPAHAVTVPVKGHRTYRRWEANTSENPALTDPKSLLVSALQDGQELAQARRASPEKRPLSDLEKRLAKEYNDAIEAWWEAVEKRLDMKPTKFGKTALQQSDYMNRLLRQTYDSPRILTLELANARAKELALAEKTTVPDFWDVYIAKRKGNRLPELDLPPPSSQSVVVQDARYQGTSGAIATPDEGDAIEVYDEQLCRSVPLKKSWLECLADHAGSNIRDIRLISRDAQMFLYDANEDRDFNFEDAPFVVDTPEGQKVLKAVIPKGRRHLLKPFGEDEEDLEVKSYTVLGPVLAVLETRTEIRCTEFFKRPGL